MSVQSEICDDSARTLGKGDILRTGVDGLMFAFTVPSRRGIRPQRAARTAIVVVILLSATAVGCSGEDQGVSDSCPSILTFGNDYEEWTSGVAELPTDQTLGMGVLPDCGDVNDDPGGPAGQVEVWSLDGVPASGAGCHRGRGVAPLCGV